MLLQLWGSVMLLLPEEKQEGLGQTDLIPWYVSQVSWKRGEWGRFFILFFKFYFLKLAHEGGARTILFYLVLYFFTWGWSNFNFFTYESIDVSADIRLWYFPNHFQHEGGAIFIFSLFTNKAMWVLISVCDIFPNNF